LHLSDLSKTKQKISKKKQRHNNLNTNLFKVIKVIETQVQKKLAAVEDQFDKRGLFDIEQVGVAIFEAKQNRV